MAREEHSASSDALGQRCKRAWFYAYVAELKDPEIEWSAVERYQSKPGPDGRAIWVDPKNPHAALPASQFAPHVAGAPVRSRQRSTSLGKAMHIVGETHYQGGAPNWASLPGQIFLSGVHHLPHPDRVLDGAVEQPISMVCNGIRWRGSRDLIVSAPSEFRRMGVDAPDGWALIDYKSSRDILRYALRADVDVFAKLRKARDEVPERLKDNFQAQLYTAATCEEKKIGSLPCRWVYFATGDKRASVPIDTTITYDVARAAVEAASERARELDAIEREDQAPQNTDACDQYGGCPYHISAGGPCNARRSIGDFVSARVLNRKKSNTMGIASKFTKLKDGDTSAPDTSTQPDASGVAEPDAQPAAEPKKRGRPSLKAKAAEPAADAVPAPKSDSMIKTITLPGENGPVSITGDARDLCDISTALAHVG